MVVAKQKRCLLGPHGGVARQDVVVAADADSSSNGGRDDAAWVVYRKAKKQSDRKGKEEKGSRPGKEKVKGDGRTPNEFNRRSGVRNTCYKCKSEYHLAPKCPLRDVPRSKLAPSSPVNRKARPHRGASGRAGT